MMLDIVLATLLLAYCPLPFPHPLSLPLRLLSPSPPSPLLLPCSYATMSEEEIKLDRYAKFRKLGQFQEFVVKGGDWRNALAEREKVRGVQRSGWGRQARGMMWAMRG